MTRNRSIPASADPLDPRDDDTCGADAVDRLARSVARAERRLRMLKEIGEIGMRLALTPD
jgi:hypothetical protein